jgi:hypothetical protein
VLIDRSHRRWIVVTVGLLVLATMLYVWYSLSWSGGPRGKTVPGILFGVAGSLLMLFAGLLSARKKVPNWRLGRAQTWLRGHIWLGLLSVPLILFHAGFHWGGPLETMLLLLVAAIVLSGVIGLALQNYMPRVMETTTPQEATYEQIPQVCVALCRTADEEVLASCGSLFEAAAEGNTMSDEGAMLREFYRSTVRPYLGAGDPAASKLHDRNQSQALFEQVRGMVPTRLHGTLARLTQICEERRQMAQQVRLHHWLHGWLFVHLPLSMALLVLTIVHIVMSLIVY